MSFPKQRVRVFKPFASIRAAVIFEDNGTVAVCLSVCLYVCMYVRRANEQASKRVIDDGWLGGGGREEKGRKGEVVLVSDECLVLVVDGEMR